MRLESGATVSLNGAEMKQTEPVFGDLLSYLDTVVISEIRR